MGGSLTTERGDDVDSEELTRGAKKKKEAEPGGGKRLTITIVKFLYH